MTSQIFAGVDEVGRGCLAGPVVSVAIILDRAIDKTLIQEDWSMQFPRKCGYRAGVAVPIPIWLDNNRGAFNEYGLPHRLWFPVSIMDQNLKDLSKKELLNFLLEWNSYASRYGSGIQIDEFSAQTEPYSSICTDFDDLAQIGIVSSDL